MRYLILILAFTTLTQAQDLRRQYGDTLVAGTKDTSYFYDVTTYTLLNDEKAKHLIMFDIWSYAPDTLILKNKQVWGRGTSWDSAWVPLMVYNPLVNAAEDTMIIINRLSNGKYYANPSVYRLLTSGNIRFSRLNPGKGRTHKIFFMATVVGR